MSDSQHPRVTPVPRRWKAVGETEFTNARSAVALVLAPRPGRPTATIGTGSGRRNGGAKPLHDLVGISGRELARWIKITTPNDRPHVVRVLEMAAAILRDEFEGSASGSHDAIDIETGEACRG
jgi:hypothetical protein